MHEAQILATLERISAQLEELPAAIAAQLGRKPLSLLAATDRELLEEVLPIISPEPGNGIDFSSKEALEYLAQYPEEIGRLRARLGGDQKNFGRRLGRLFGRACGHVVAGMVLERIGDDRGGALWMLKRVSDGAQTRKTRTTD